MGSTKLKTWTLNKTHQAQATSSYGGHWSPKKLKNYTKYTKHTEYKTHHKNTSKTLKTSRKVDFENWALETGEGTKINKVWEKVPRIYDTLIRSLKKFASVRETRGFLNNLYWWPLVEAYVLHTSFCVVSHCHETDRACSVSTFHVIDLPTPSMCV